MKISEIITDKYKLRIPPAVYYELLVDVQEAEEEQEPTTKNDLGVDLISRADVLKLMQDNWHAHNGDWAMQESMDDIRALPSVTPQEPQSFKWCTDCKEYDQEKHCCHRWSKVIRDTVEEMKQEPKTGHWREDIDNNRRWDRVRFYCSECGEMFGKFRCLDS